MPPGVKPLISKKKYNTRKRVYEDEKFANEVLALIPTNNYTPIKWVTEVRNRIDEFHFVSDITVKKYYDAVTKALKENDEELYKPYRKEAGAFFPVEFLKKRREMISQNHAEMQNRVANPELFDGAEIVNVMFALLKETANPNKKEEQKKRLGVLAMALMLFSGRRKAELVLGSTRFVSLQNAITDKEFPQDDEHVSVLPYQCWFFGQLKEKQGGAAYGTTSYIVHLIVPFTYFMQLFAEFRALLAEMQFTFVQVVEEKEHSGVPHRYNMRSVTRSQRRPEILMSPKEMREAQKKFDKEEKKKEKQVKQKKKRLSNRQISVAADVNQKFDPIANAVFKELKPRFGMTKLTLHKFRHINANIAYAIFEKNKAPSDLPEAEQTMRRLQFLFKQLGHVDFRSTNAYAVFKQKDELPLDIHEWTGFINDAIKSSSSAAADDEKSDDEKDTPVLTPQEPLSPAPEQDENENEYVDADNLDIILPLQSNQNNSETEKDLYSTLGIFFPAFKQHPTRGIEFYGGPYEVRTRFASIAKDITSTLQRKPVRLTSLSTRVLPFSFGAAKPFETLHTLQAQFARDNHVQMEVLRRGLLPFARDVPSVYSHVANMYYQMNMHFVQPQRSSLFAGDSEASKRLTKFIESIGDGHVKLHSANASHSHSPTTFVKWLCQSVCNYVPK